MIKAKKLNIMELFVMVVKFHLLLELDINAIVAKTLIYVQSVLMVTINMIKHTHLVMLNIQLEVVPFSKTL